MDNVVKKLCMYFTRYNYLYQVCDYDIYFAQKHVHTQLLSEDANIALFTEESVTELLRWHDGYVKKYIDVTKEKTDITGIFCSTREPPPIQNVIPDARFGQFVCDTMELMLPMDYQDDEPQQICQMPCVRTAKQRQIEGLIRYLCSALATGAAFVDMGGGVGHLARTLVERGMVAEGSAYTIERDRRLVEKGKCLDRAQRFVQHAVGQEDVSFDTLPGGLRPGERGCVVSAIHTCGGFGVQLVRMLVATQRACVYFAQAPCCYHALDWDTFPVSSRLAALGAVLRREIGPNARSFFNIACTGVACGATSGCHRRLVYDRLNTALSSLVGRGVAAKRCRVTAGLRSYFHQQLHAFLEAHRGALQPPAPQWWSEEQYHLASLLTAYATTPDDHTLDLVVCAVYGLAGDSAVEQLERRYSGPPYCNMLYFTHAVRAIASRVVERLLVSDRYLFLLDHGANPTVWLYCHACDSPRNLLLTCRWPCAERPL